MPRWIHWGYIALLLAGCGFTPMTVTLSADSDNAHGDGTSPITITATVMRGTKALDGDSVHFKGDLPGCDFAPITDTTTAPDPNGCTGDSDLSAGSAIVRIYSMAKGTVNVTATYTDPVATDTGTGKMSVAFTGANPNVASFDYVGAEPAQIPLKGSGKVTFLAKDSQGQPMPNVAVTFTISHDPGGASIDPTTSTSAADGTAATTVTAGTVPGTVTVKIADSTGAVTQESGAIAISGGGINAKNLTLACPRYNIGGLEADGLEMTCTVFGADLNGAFVPNSKVIFKTEAGGVPDSADFAEDADTGGGIATFTYRTQCKWPIDVPPLANEPTHPCSFQNQCGATGPVTETRKDCNPRDGLATLIAITTGSEDFTDNNGNGVWDPGEPFVDLPEPFVDANDDGTYNPGEQFYDANNNGKWDGPNGVYDSNTAIWKQVKILWTGAPDFLTWSSIKPSGISQTGQHCSTTTYTLTLLDINGNAPSSWDSADGVTATAVEIGSTAPDVGTPSAYQDWTSAGQPNLAAKTGQGVVTVDVSDSHECSPDCLTAQPPSCSAYQFKVQFSLTHTIAQDGDTTQMEEDLTPLTVGGTWK